MRRGGGDNSGFDDLRSLLLGLVPVSGAGAGAGASINMASGRKNMESGRKNIIGGLFSDGRKNVGIFFPFFGIFSAPPKNRGDVFSTSGGFFPTL